MQATTETTKTSCSSALGRKFTPNMRTFSDSCIARYARSGYNDGTDEAVTFANTNSLATRRGSSSYNNRYSRYNNASSPPISDDNDDDDEVRGPVIKTKPLPRSSSSLNNRRYDMTNLDHDDEDANDREEAETLKEANDKWSEIEQGTIHLRMKQMQALVNNRVLSDVTFYVGEGKEPIHAHRILLASAGSPVLDKIVGPNGAMKDARGGKVHLPQFRPEIFKTVLTFVYTGSVPREALTEADVLDVIECANYFQLDNLVTLAALAARTIMTVKNVLAIAEKSRFLHQYLFDECLHFIHKNTDAVVKSSRFTSISDDLFQIMIQSGALAKLSELRLFELIAEWTIENCKREGLGALQADNIRRRGRKLFELVRYDNIDPKDLVERVEPLGYVEHQILYNAFKSHSSALSRYEEQEKDDKTSGTGSRVISPTTPASTALTSKRRMSTSDRKRTSPRSFRLDPERCAEGIALSNNNTKATMLESGFWRFVLGNRSYKRGSVYWEVKIDSISQASDCWIGVYRPSHRHRSSETTGSPTSNDLCGIELVSKSAINIKNCWMFDASLGKKVSAAGFETYSKRRAKEGDVVGVLLEFSSSPHTCSSSTALHALTPTSSSQVSNLSNLRGATAINDEADDDSIPPPIGSESPSSAVSSSGGSSTTTTTSSPTATYATLSFFLNGINLGVAFTNLKRPLIPAIRMYYSNTSVSVKMPSSPSDSANRTSAAAAAAAASV
eukprot:GEZU01025418.1.p1 GENE.GEZU01025418.1~~GEZU01025418.1.p1  ORF type:complete len:786 (+),score=169.63 GEZU01025418.1:170-2359(+)